MHTEEEAKQKWCPKIQVSITGTEDSEVDNRIYDSNGKIHPSCCCIASQCMAWRWKQGHPIAHNRETGEERVLWPGDGYRADKEVIVKHTVSEYGYCGLAGPGEQ